MTANPLAAIAADPLAAVCAYLLSTQVNGLTGGRVFRPDLPRSEDQFMPRACVVVRRAGGYTLYGKDYRPIADPRVDLACYGESAMEADIVARTALLMMKRMTRGVWANCHVNSANISGGPLPSFEPNTLWPLSLFSIQLMHAEDAVV